MLYLGGYRGDQHSSSRGFQGQSGGIYKFLTCLAGLLALVPGGTRVAISQTVPSVGAIETTGTCSPVIVGAGGAVTISCQGVDPQALRHLNELLDAKDIQLVEKVKEASDWARKYRALEEQLRRTDDGGGLAAAVRTSLEAGNLEDAKATLHKLEAQLAAEKVELSTTQRISRVSIKVSLQQLLSEGLHFGGVFHTESRWTKMPISVCFLSGNRIVRSYVAAIAQEWTLYGNVDFDFGSLGNPRTCNSQVQNDVRVGFDQAGFWAYIGDTANVVPQSSATLNLGFSRVADEEVVNGQYRGAILHEFGHVIGFDHAIRNPGGHCVDEIDFDRLHSYAKELGFSEGAIDNIVRTDEPAGLESGVYDNKSVMNYSLPEALFKRGVSSPCYSAKVQELSIRDKLAIFQNYPLAQ
jgi:hypothetical protein